MTVQVTTTPAPVEVVRRSANYHPSIWGDRFIAYNSNIIAYNSNNLTKDSIVEQQIEKLKEEVKMKFSVAATADRNYLREIIRLIDTIQRLGLAYHFAKEIEEGLEHVYGTYNNNKNEDDSLYHCGPSLSAPLTTRAYCCEWKDIRS